MEEVSSYLLVSGALAALLGLALLFKGFSTHKRYQTINKAVAVSAAHVAALPDASWVKISGLAVAREPLTAPGSGSPCLYYHHRVQQMRRVHDSDSGDSLGYRKEWQTMAESKEHAPFFIRDATGEVLVVPEGARFESLQTLENVPGSAGYEPAPGEGEVGFLDRALDVYDILGEDVGSYRTSEWVVPVEAPVLVCGSVYNTAEGSRVSAGGWGMIVSAMGEEELLKKEVLRRKLKFILGIILAVGGVGAVIVSLQFITW